MSEDSPVLDKVEFRELLKKTRHRYSPYAEKRKEGWEAKDRILEHDAELRERADSHDLICPECGGYYVSAPVESKPCEYEECNGRAVHPHEAVGQLQADLQVARHVPEGWLTPYLDLYRNSAWFKQTLESVIPIVVDMLAIRAEKLEDETAQEIHRLRTESPSLLFDAEGVCEE